MGGRQGSAGDRTYHFAADPQLFLQQNPQYCLLYALGPTADFVIPLLKVSSAMVMPSGTPPTFCV
jgi:hypothetical protein